MYYLPYTIYSRLLGCICHGSDELARILTWFAVCGPFMRLDDPDITPVEKEF